MVQAALASLDDVKQFIETRSDDDSFDRRLLMLARTATRQLERFTRSEFPKEERTEFFDSRCLIKNNREIVPLMLRLKARPVDFGQTFSVRHDVDRVFGAATELASTDWHYDTGKQRLVITAALTAAPMALRVTYTGGYAVDDPNEGGAEDDYGDIDLNMSAAAPDMLKMACITQVMFLWNKMADQSIGRTSDGETDFATSFNLAPEAADLAAPFSHLIL
jgi:uncharacterized membrane protein YccC